MAKNKEIRRQETHKGKIKQSVVIKHANTGNENPVFSFRHVCDNHCLLSDWQGNELIELISTLKTMETLTWNQLVTNRHSGLDYRKENNYAKPLPPRVSPDIDVCRVKVCERKRLWGYRAGNVFRIMWFDRNHEVIPYHKQRKA